MNNSRRDFIRSASTLLAAAAMPSALHGFPKTVAPSDRLNVAAIGINGMGWADLNALLKNPGVQCVALCDVDTNVLDHRAAELAQRSMRVKTYGDYRQLLQNQDVAAVVIATPDCWQCVQMT